MAGPSDEENIEASFSSQVKEFDFSGEAIDTSLRKLLAKVLLPKEAQQIDRAMEDFAKRYYECNPTLVDSPDVVYAVAFSILLLHTDAHNKNVKQKMNKDTFIMRTKVIEGGEGVPHEILDVMYDNIVLSEFTYADKDMFGKTEKPNSWFSKKKTNDTSVQSAQSIALLNDLSQKLEQLMPAENTFTYKQTLKPIPIMEIHFSLLRAKTLRLSGVRSRHDHDATDNTFTIRVTKAGMLDRKYDIGPGGKKATARGWRPFGIILSGSQLIFFSDLTTFQTYLQEEDPQTPLSPEGHHLLPPPPAPIRPIQIISLSYAITICDESYTKYPHTFRLMTGEGQQFLLRASSDEERQDWMLKINYAATLKTTGGRQDLSSKVLELSHRIDEQVRLLDRELQLRRNLMVLTPLQRLTRDRIVWFAEGVGKRIRSKRIELQRLECYRDYLESELNWSLQAVGKRSEEVSHRHVRVIHTELDHLRRRSQSNPVPSDNQLLMPQAYVPLRQRSGSEASFAHPDDDNMSVIIVNEQEDTNSS